MSKAFHHLQRPSRLALLEARVRALEEAIQLSLHRNHNPSPAIKGNKGIVNFSPLEAEINALQDKNATLEQALAEKQEELDRNVSEIVEKCGLQKNLEITLTAREEELARKNRELEQSHTHINRLEQELEKKRGLISVYEKRLEETDKKIADLEKTLNENRAALRTSQTMRQETARQIDQLQYQLNISASDYMQASEKLAQQQNQLKIVTRAYEELKELSLPDQEMLATLWEAVENLSPESRGLLEKYYVLSSLYAFLPGIGLFGRIEQFWDSCAKLAREGKLPNDIPTILTTLVYLYNSAMPDSKAAIIPVDIGSAYDYNCEDRLGASGSTVSRCILPGLIRPNGEISKKSLVVLK